MSSEARSARTPADLSGHGSVQTFAGLLDVLDRADGGLSGRRPRPRGTASYRAAGSRSGVRTVPLRSVQPPPLARPVPSAPPAPRPMVSIAPAATQGSALRLVGHRMALWGAGPNGEYLAWAGPDARTAAHSPHAAPRPSRWSALLRRVA